MSEENKETKNPHDCHCFDNLRKFLILVVVFLFVVYATNLLGGKRLFLRSSEPISFLQIMAEENNEFKIPQRQNGHEAAVIPPIYGTKVVLQIMAEENKETKIPQGQNSRGSAAIPPRMNQKTKWPEVVGLTVEEAERIIKEEKPGVQIQVVPPEHFVTCDYEVQRVRLYVDSSGKVQWPPIIG